MTSIVFAFGNDTIYGVRYSYTNVTLTAVTRRIADDVLVFRSTIPLQVDGEVATLDLPVSGYGEAWLINAIDSRGDAVSGYYKIPDVESVYFHDLEQVDPDTLEPTAEPEAEWWIMARSTVTGGTVNEVGDLILKRNDGNTVNAGRVKGDAGKNGVDGKDGKDGRDGIDGTNGRDGVDGIDGQDGRDGVDGQNGRDGVDGKDGQDGTNGIDGQDGAPGQSVTIVGRVPTVTDLPTTANEGDGYITEDDGHLHVFIGGAFIDVGQIKGNDGRDGVDGQDGANGTNGIDGVDGKDGVGSTLINPAHSPDVPIANYPNGLSYMYISGGSQWPIGYATIITVKASNFRGTQVIVSSANTAYLSRASNGPDWSAFDDNKGTNVLSPNSLVRRDAGNRFNANPPIEDYNVANKLYVDSLIKTSVTAEQFGAVGNGTTNDTAALQAAINYAVTNGVPLVLDSSKTYRVTAGLTSPAITKASTLSIVSSGGVANIVSSDQSTSAIFDLSGSTVGTLKTLTGNATHGDGVITVNSTTGISRGSLLVMESSDPWHYDPRTESTDARRSELHVVSSVSSTQIRLFGRMAESYGTAAQTLSIQAYHPLTVLMSDIRIVRDLPPVAQESARHGIVRASFGVSTVFDNVHVDGGTEYGFSLRNQYAPKIVGGSAIRCNNYYTGYGASIAGSHWFEVTGLTVMESRRGIDVTQGGKTVSRFGNVHHNSIIGGGMNSRGDLYGWNLNGSTSAQQSGMGSHGAADQVVYSNNITSSLHDPYSIRGANESVLDNTHYGECLNGMVGLSFGGGAITIKGNKCITGMEGDKVSTAYGNLTNQRTDEFLVIYQSCSPNMNLTVENNECEVRSKFIRIQDAATSVPLRMVVKDNVVYYRSSDAELTLIHNEGAPYTYPASAYRNVLALNRQHALAGSGTIRLTKNINMLNARVLEYEVGGATN